MAHEQRRASDINPQTDREILISINEKLDGHIADHGKLENRMDRIEAWGLFSVVVVCLLFGEKLLAILSILK